MQGILELNIVSGSGVGHGTPDFDAQSERSNYRRDSQSTSKLSWCENVKTVSSKAHSMIGMINRSVGFNSPIDVKRQLYLAHVRSILEYYSPMWSPNHVKDIIKLERVQRQASKFILNDYVSPYHERCTALSILPLCFHR